MFYDIQQNTEEWLDMRAGKVTGSAISKIMANCGKAFGEPAKKLAVKLANERLNGQRTKGDRYTNVHMEAGHIEEPVARQMYEEKTGSIITNGGFYDNGKTGCSPDGHILFENGGIEIKSVIPETHFKVDKCGSFDPTYKWQFLFNIRETGWNFIDFVSYCEQYYKPKSLLIVRIEKCEYEKELSMIDNRLIEFESLVEDAIEVMRKP